MSDTIPQSVSNGCRKYVKSRIIINIFNTFNNVTEKLNALKEQNIKEPTKNIVMLNYNPLTNEKNSYA
jgi:hypothetical protein